MNIFSNVGHSLVDKIEDKSTDDLTQFLHVIDKSTRFKFKSATKQWVLTALKGLKESKASGPEKFPTEILKDATELICLPLALILNVMSRFGWGVF